MGQNGFCNGPGFVNGFCQSLTCREDSSAGVVLLFGVGARRPPPDGVRKRIGRPIYLARGLCHPPSLRPDLIHRPGVVISLRAADVLTARKLGRFQLLL
jgi:hypothetical protein